MRTTIPLLIAAIGALSRWGRPWSGFRNAVVFKEEGQASYYGGQFHGRTTASGQPFDQKP